MQRMTYLIDSENVNDAWVKLLPRLERKDRIIIFYTENSPHFTVDSARIITDYKDRDISWKKCFAGRNALDFQLVSHMGYLISRYPRDTYAIMSNDTGFDAAVKYWTQEGIAVSRIRGNGKAVTGSMAEAVKERQHLGNPQSGEETGRAADRGRQASLRAAEHRTSEQKPARDGWLSRWFSAKTEPEGEITGETVEEALASEASRKRSRNRRRPRQNGRRSGTAEQELYGTRSRKEGTAEQEFSGAGTDQALSRDGSLAGDRPQRPEEDPQSGSQENSQGERSQENSQGEHSQENSQGERSQENFQSERSQENFRGERSGEIPVAAVIGLCRSIPIRKQERIHEALVALLGGDNGREVYHFLKENGEFHEKLGTIYLADKNARIDNYLKIVFDYNHIKLEQSEDIIRLLGKYQSRDLNGFYKAMTGCFGKSRGSQYYSILKPHIRVIKKL